MNDGKRPKRRKGNEPATPGGSASGEEETEEREAIAQMQKLEKAILEKSQLSSVGALVTLCQDTRMTATVTYNGVKALQRVFGHLIGKGVLNLAAHEEGEEEEGKRTASADVLVRFKSCLQTLVTLITHRHEQVKALALKVLMGFLHKKTTAYNTANNENTFPFSHFSALVEALIAESNGAETSLLSLWVNKYFGKYYDVRYYTMKALRGLCEQRKFILNRKDQSEVALLVTSIYLLLQKMTMPKDDKDISSFWITPNEEWRSKPPFSQSSARKGKGKTKDVFAHEEYNRQKKRKQRESWVKRRTGSLAVKFVAGHRKVFEECWIAFLQLPLTTAIYKDVLRRMDSSILPNMVNPVKLIDFLKDSYDIGGVVSILALHGLFILITKYNLDYPDFYKKLYGLFQPNIFHVKYRARFFRLVNIFLKSSHLPAYLVAAFVKRMARMALHAPPSGAIFVIAFAYNLLKRHPQCLVMLHAADANNAGGSLLPNDDRKPRGQLRSKGESEGQAAPDSSASATVPQVSAPVLMLGTGEEGLDESRKRKRDDGPSDEAQGRESSESSKGPATATDHGSDESMDGIGQLKNQRRRRSRGGKESAEQKGDHHTGGNSQPNGAVDDASRVSSARTKVPLEDNAVELGRYLHQGSVGSDPFVFEEMDPQRCKALESSLWELKALQHHYVPQVSKLAKIFDEPPTKPAFDLDDFVEHSYLSLFEAHVQRKTKSATALAYHPQDTLFSPTDCFQSNWTFLRPYSSPAASSRHD